MFDIGFSELMVIAVVALVVLGPERLPRVARTAGHLFGRLQRYVNEVKADINREMELDELRKYKSEIESAASALQTEIRTEAEKAQSTLTGLADEASLKPEIEKVDAELRAMLEETQRDPHAAPAEAAAAEAAASQDAPARPTPAGSDVA